MKLKTSILALIMAFACQHAFAGKTVVFNLQQAVGATNYAKEKQAALQSKPEFAKLVADFQGFQAELEGLEKEAETKGLTWSAEQRTEHVKKRDYIVADYKLVGQKLQKEQEVLAQAIFAETQPHVATVIEQLVKSDDIDVILRRDAVWHAEPEQDITLKVVAELNKVLK